MEIQIKVVNQNLKVTTNSRDIVEGSQNFVAFKFILDDSWAGLLPFAQFTQNGNAYNVYLNDDNIAYLPPEIKAGKVTLMLYGSSGTVKGLTNVLEFNIIKNHFIGDSQSVEITQSLYDQLIKKVNTVLDIPDSDYNDLIVQSITNYLDKAIQNGSLGALTIADGSITRNKVDSNFESTLVKADNAMQANIYDPDNIETDIFDYAKQKANEAVNLANQHTDDILFDELLGVEN